MGKFIQALCLSLFQELALELGGFFFSLKGLGQISSGLTLYIFHKGQLFVFFLFPRLSWVFLFLLPLLAGVAFCERGTHGSEI